MSCISGSCRASTRTTGSRISLKTSPDVGLDDVQEALVEALMSGCVRLFDTSDESWLDDETALAAARNAGSFKVGTAPREIALAITEIGEEASGEAWERYRSAAGF